MKISASINKTILVAALLGASATAFADAIPYAGVGTENSVLYSFTAAATGDVNAYFYGSTAGYTNTLSLLVNGVATVESAGGLLNNHTSFIGQMVNMGSANAGDTLTFRLNVLSTGDLFFSDKSLNADGVNHVYATSFSGDLGAGIPVGTYVAFEDLYGGGDLNYHDENFVFTNVATRNVAEPETIAMLTLGVGIMGLMGRRRNKRSA